jgi:hypothetical protein
MPLADGYREWQDRAATRPAAAKSLGYVLLLRRKRGTKIGIALPDQSQNGMPECLAILAVARATPFARTQGRCAIRARRSRKTEPGMRSHHARAVSCQFDATECNVVASIRDYREQPAKMVRRRGDVAVESGGGASRSACLLQMPAAGRLLLSPQWASVRHEWKANWR